MKRNKVDAVSKFLALKVHKWRGQYQRVFSFGENLFQTLDPATFAVTNAWDYKGKKRTGAIPRKNLAVIIVRVILMSLFLFYGLLSNHIFQTNPNSVTNCFKLILSIYNFTTTLLLRRFLIFEQFC